MAPSASNPASEAEFSRGAPRGAGAGGLRGRLRVVGEDLGQALTELLAALPGAPLRPSQLMRLLDLNRAVASKVLGAVASRDPLELLHRVPGPEPLRRLVRHAGELGLGAERLADAEAAIEAFDQLIRTQAGTRGALDALISAERPGARERFELSSRYAVHKGLGQLKGAQAEHWIGTAIVAPAASAPQRLDLTWLNGALGMQRLRPGVTVRFSYRHRRGDEPGDDSAPDPWSATDEAGLPPASVVPLDAFCVNPPAVLEARAAGRAIHYTLPDELLGPREAVDLLVVDHHPAAMSRYARGVPARRASLFVEPAVPVANLLFDVLLHEEAFPGADPELVVFDTGYDGIANVNDLERAIDRMDVAETISFLGQGSARLGAAELPRYTELLAFLAERFGWDLERFRAYRARLQYPVYGWQTCMAFTPPADPGAA